MAKVTGPMFSMTASGTIGDGLTYRKGKVGCHVLRKQIHHDTAKATQLTQRASYSSAIVFWKSLHVHEKEFYNYLGDQQGITGYNYAIGQFLEGQAPEW